MALAVHQQEEARPKEKEEKLDLDLDLELVTSETKDLESATEYFDKLDSINEKYQAALSQCQDQDQDLDPEIYTNGTKKPLDGVARPFNPSEADFLWQQSSRSSGGKQTPASERADAFLRQARERTGLSIEEVTQPRSSQDQVQDQVQDQDQDQDQDQVQDQVQLSTRFPKGLQAFQALERRVLEESLRHQISSSTVLTAPGSHGNASPGMEDLTPATPITERPVGDRVVRPFFDDPSREVAASARRGGTYSMVSERSSVGTDATSSTTEKNESKCKLSEKEAVEVREEKPRGVLREELAYFQSHTPKAGPAIITNNRPEA